MRPRFATSRFFAAVLLAAGLALHPSPSPGVPAKTVPFVFNDIDGKPLRLADYRGQWVLVAFWAPWCPLCKLQMPSLKQLDARPDLTVIGVGLDYDMPEALRGTAENHDLAFRIVAGGSRRAPDSPFRQVGPVDYFPTSYLYDPTGEVVMYIPGQVNKSKVLAFMDTWRATPGTASVAGAGKSDKLADFMKHQYGKAGEQIHGEWRRMVEGTTNLDMTARLERANDFFNRRLRIGNDQRIWGKTDHWATLGEVLGKGAGDAEDFVLAKYFTLLAMNVPAEQLHLTYVRTREAGDPVHMVLAYFAPGSREPLILDNRLAEVRPATQRTDLKPIYSFNKAGAWGDSQGLADLVGGRATPWEDALRRARNEGFE